MKEEKHNIEENKENPRQNEYNIDMNWNEVLSELDKSDSVTVRTVLSPNNDQKVVQTAEKVS